MILKINMGKEKKIPKVLSILRLKTFLQTLKSQILSIDLNQNESLE